MTVHHVAHINYTREPEPYIAHTMHIVGGSDCRVGDLVIDNGKPYTIVGVRCVIERLTWWQRLKRRRPTRDWEQDVEPCSSTRHPDHAVVTA